MSNDLVFPILECEPDVEARLLAYAESNSVPVHHTGAHGTFRLLFDNGPQAVRFAQVLRTDKSSFVRLLAERIEVHADTRYN